MPPIFRCSGPLQPADYIGQYCGDIFPDKAMMFASNDAFVDAVRECGGEIVYIGRRGQSIDLADGDRRRHGQAPDMPVCIMLRPFLCQQRCFAAQDVHGAGVDRLIGAGA